MVDNLAVVFPHVVVDLDRGSDLLAEGLSLTLHFKFDRLDHFGHLVDGLADVVAHRSGHPVGLVEGAGHGPVPGLPLQAGDFAVHRFGHL